MNDATSELQQHYLFAALDEVQHAQLMVHSRTRELAAGEHLFVQGDRADAFWWLQRGQIKLYRLSRDGQQKVMGLVMPRQSFAEGTLFMEPPCYPVNAEAVSASVVLGIDRAAYLDILQTSFATCRGLFRQMVQRTRRHLDEIEALTIQNTRFRLVHYLLHLHENAPAGSANAIKLPARKSLIASQLAMQPETLSRLFRDLDKREFIHVRGDTIDILDPDGLRQLLM